MAKATDQLLAFVADTPGLTPDEPAPTSRFQLAKAGTFKHPVYGEFTVDGGTFESFQRNFQAAGRLCVDFEHSPEKGQGTEAAGWITKLEAVGDALFATVEWTRKGAEAIRDRLYLFVSPTWKLDDETDAGESVGARLRGAGLTNRPWFEGMGPVVTLSSAFAEVFDHPAELAEQITLEITPELDLDTVVDEAAEAFADLFAIGGGGFNPDQKRGPDGRWVHTLDGRKLSVDHARREQTDYTSAHGKPSPYLPDHVKPYKDDDPYKSGASSPDLTSGSMSDEQRAAKDAVDSTTARPGLRKVFAEQLKEVLAGMTPKGGNVGTGAKGFSGQQLAHAKSVAGKRALAILEAEHKTALKALASYDSDEPEAETFEKPKKKKDDDPAKDPAFEKLHPRGTGGLFVESGSEGKEVEGIQTAVGAKADGVFGDKTEAKVRAYQKAHGLQVDGVVGHQTAMALFGHGKKAKAAKVGELTDAQRKKLKTHTFEQIEIGDPAASDSRPEMEFSDTQIASLASTFGLDPETATADEVLTHAAAQVALAKKAPKDGDYLVQTVDGDIVMTADQLIELREKAAKGTESEENLSAMRFNDAFDRAVRRGCAAPAERDDLLAFFESNETAALAAIERKPAIVSVEPKGEGSGQILSDARRDGASEFSIPGERSSEIEPGSIEALRRAEVYAANHEGVSVEDAFIGLAEGRL